MTIEVKQLLIKSSVLPQQSQEDLFGADNTQSVEELVAYILEECREMVAEVLRKERER